MTNLWIYFLPAIITLGVITSYEDIRIGKIRNKWIILALVYAFAVYSVLITYAFFTTEVNKDYFTVLLTNLLFTIMVGFGAWYFGIWTAGDGKLFIAFSSLIPLSVYQLGYQKWMPSITLLVNIFIPALLIMLVWVFFKVKTRNIQKSLKPFLKEFFQLKQLSRSVIELFAVYWVTRLLLSLIGFSSNYVLMFILTVVILSGVEKMFGAKCFYVFITISLIRLVMDKSVYSLSFLTNFLILIFVWRLFKSFLTGSLSKISQDVFAKEMKVIDLKPGMVLSETIQKVTEQELNDLKKVAGIEVIKYKGFYYVKRPKSSTDTGGFIGEEAEGLTNGQVNKIKELGIKKVLVSQMIPFAPFMFLGVLITLIVNGNILIVVKNLI